MKICSYKEYLFPILVAQVGISLLHSLVNNDIFLKKWQQKSDKSFNFWAEPVIAEIFFLKQFSNVTLYTADDGSI